jgi:hypothetical protein
MAGRFAALDALLAFAMILTMSSPASAAPDRDAVRTAFAEARSICERDGSRLWGVSLCGPIMIVDWRDRAIVASHQDANEVLTADGDVWVGTLPHDVILANTAIEWSGTHWTQLVAPLPPEPAQVRVLLAHEMFHRVQPSLGLSRSEQPNQHFDTLEGRYWLQLEWRALAAALKAPDAEQRIAALADALAFRCERHRLFPDAAAQEGALEIHEGVAEYTGVKLGLADPAERTAYALHDLEAFVSAPTFVRSFAYATGPAYGLMLDDADPAWRTKLGAGDRLDQLLAKAIELEALPDEPLDQRAGRYDDGTLRLSEVRRDEDRRARLAAYRALLIDGPVLVLPLNRTNRQFNPQTLVALDGIGTVYPTMRLMDDWGALDVEDGGALVRDEPKQATVSAADFDRSGMAGKGWRLTLKPGWEVGPGEREGDLTLRCVDGCER